MYRHLSEQQIVDWAVTHREETGHWPNKKSGPVVGSTGETWAGVDRALCAGKLGLPGGSSLAQLLWEQRGARCASYTPPLTEELILAWADAYHQATGEWPTTTSGRVLDVPLERWGNINSALSKGSRGLPGGTTLAQLLEQHRGVRNPKHLPILTEAGILAWADAFHQQHSLWPKADSGLIPDSGGETWGAIDTALFKGKRGLPGGSSLAQLLEEQRGVRNVQHLPDLTEPMLLAWAEAHRQRTGRWPTVNSGPIPEAPEENWNTINVCLERGNRGLPGGTTLARLLKAQRGRRNHMDLPPYSLRQILAWADAFFKRTGDWPRANSGEIPEAPGEKWRKVENALRGGMRGLRGGSSLAQLLDRRRGKRNIHGLPNLTIKGILDWAVLHFQRTGHWPNSYSGPVHDAPGETWNAIDTALRDGLRGMPGGKSLAKLLDRKCGVRNSKDLSLLTIPEILRWADEYRQLHGILPSHKSGPIPGTNGDSWRTVNGALRKGARGMAGGSSLSLLLAEHRHKVRWSRRPPLSLPLIHTWALSHRQNTGDWPKVNSGPVEAAPGETWLAVDVAMRHGSRNLPGGTSLARFLREQPQATNGAGPIANPS